MNLSDFEPHWRTKPNCIYGKLVGIELVNGWNFILKTEQSVLFIRFYRGGMKHVEEEFNRVCETLGDDPMLRGVQIHWNRRADQIELGQLTLPQLTYMRLTYMGVTF